MTVEVEKGILSGTLIDMEKRGHEYVQGWKGDLRMELEVEGRKGVKREGSDLRIDRCVSL